MADRRERLDDPEEALATAQDGRQAQIWTALPGIVESFDPDALTVSVQPAIQANVTAEDGSVRAAALPLLVDVPVVFPQGGGFLLTFPVRAGDECLVVFSSRCIDSWWQSGGVQPQAEQRLHDLSDGFALVGPRSRARRVTPAVSTEAVMLRAEDGSSFVEIAPDGVMTCRAQTQLVLDAPQILLKGAISMVSQSGGATTATLSGGLDASGDVTANGISLHGHSHKNVQPGNGSSGGPQ